MVLIINSLVPVFAVILLGGILRRTGFLSEETTAGLNKIAYWIALPILLFIKLAQASITLGSAGKLFQTMVIGTFAGAIIAWIMARLFRIPPRSTGVVIQAAFRGNLAFLGLPIVLFTSASLPTLQRDQLESSVVLAITLTVILYSFLSVITLVYFNRDKGAKLDRKIFWGSLIKNPLAIGCIAGVLVNQFGIPLPIMLSRTCEAIAPAAFPVALLGIGSQLAATRIRTHANWAILASLIKIGICPLVGYFVGTGLGLSGLDLRVALLFCAMPTAVSSYVLADQLGADAPLAASSVVTSTVLSFFSLSLILLLPL